MGEHLPAAILPARDLNGLLTGGNIVRSRADAHRVFDASQGDQVIVNRIEIALLSPGQGSFGVGDLGRRGIPLLKAGANQPVVFLGLGHSRTRTVDSQPGGNQLAIRFGNLEGDGIGDGFRLGHGGADLGFGNAQFGHTFAALKQAPFQFDKAHR